ncbi:MAG: hypothetical protein IPM35_32140 [Myxococcales bacterium]|nr:hypothetical protein [Myxococcales bacterium]
MLNQAVAEHWPAFLERAEAHGGLPRFVVKELEVPWGLRALLGYDRKLCAEVVSVFMGEVDRSLRWRAKRELGLASVAEAHPGGVAAVQRTDSALRLNVHFHSRALDGVYVHQSGDPRSPFEYRELAAPTHADIAEVASRTAARVEKILRAHGGRLDPELGDDTPPELALDEPGLAPCYAAAAQGISVSGE